MPAPIYLDNAATTLPLPEVIAAVARTSTEIVGNPSSNHGYGQQAKRVLEDAREFLRGTLSAAQVVFTSGGSEADQLGILGAARRRPPGRILMGAADHPAVLAQRELLERWGHRVTLVPVTADGDMDPEALFDLLGPDVRVMSILHGHNELGTLARVEELTSIARRVAKNVHVHVDLVQAFGKVPFDLDEVDADSVAVSGHKLHGPRGIGLLALSSKAEIAPMLLGGGQEQGLRGGTENVAGAVGLMVAAEQAFANLRPAAQHCEALAQRLLTQLQPLGGIERLGHPDRHLPHVVLLRIEGIVGSSLQERCDARGVMLSTGSACHEGKSSSHVHTAIGLDRQQSREIVRISFSRFTTVAELTTAIEILKESIEALRNMAPSRGGARQS